MKKRTRGQKKVGIVMKEFKKGKLRSGGSGKKVTNPKQAIAIALSEAGLSFDKKPKKKRAPKKKLTKKSTRKSMKKRKKE